MRAAIKPAGKKKDSGEIEILPDDVFLVSYPKSGNTWLRFLIGNYITDCGVDFSNSHLVMPDVHFNPKDCSGVEFRPRFIKSHKPYTPSYPRVIYIIRDGRDAAVSYYFYQQKAGKLEKNAPFAAFLEKFAREGIEGYGTWSDHVESWLEKRGQGNMLVLKYEEMLDDTERELDKVVRFVGLEYDSEKIKRAVKASSFKEMQKLEVEQHDEHIAKFGVSKEILFVRKGQKGDWSNHFSKENEELFLSYHGKTLEKLGYILKLNMGRKC